MTPWRWWAGHIGEPVYEIAEASTREDVIASARREIASSEAFQIVEARSSEAAKYEGYEFVPFVRTRNHEIIQPEAGEG